MRILILTDSLGLPREKPEYVAFEETWPYLLKQELAEAQFFQISMGGATIDDLYRQLGYYTVVKPDIVILQSGIVDCAPRGLKRFELLAMQNYRVLKKFVLPALQKKSDFLRRNRKICYTPPVKFQNFVRYFIEEFGKEKVYWIGILPASQEYETKLPGITNAIQLYNGILREKLTDNFIDTSAFPLSGIMSDFHHPNAEGHKWVFERLAKKLKK